MEQSQGFEEIKGVFLSKMISFYNSLQFCALLSHGETYSCMAQRKILLSWSQRCHQQQTFSSSRYMITEKVQKLFFLIHMSLEFNDENWSTCVLYRQFLDGNLPGLGNSNMISPTLVAEGYYQKISTLSSSLKTPGVIRDAMEALDWKPYVLRLVYCKGKILCMTELDAHFHKNWTIPLQR